MTLIIVKNKIVASLGEMNRLVLKKIFDQEHMTLEEERILDESIEAWVRKVDLEPYEKNELRVIVNALLDDKDGKYNSLKQNFKKHEIDYRKVFDAGL